MALPLCIDSRRHLAGSLRSVSIGFEIPDILARSQGSGSAAAGNFRACFNHLPDRLKGLSSDYEAAAEADSLGRLQVTWVPLPG